MDRPKRRTRKSIEPLLKWIVERLRQEYQPQKIILFGSYAYGQPTEDSDIDLFIVKKTDARRVDRFVQVSRILDNGHPRVSISPLVYTPEEVDERLALGDQFVEEVLNRGEVLYAVA